MGKRARLLLHALGLGAVLAAGFWLFAPEKMNDRERALLDGLGFDREIGRALKKATGREIKRMTVLDPANFVTEIEIDGVYVNGTSDEVRRHYAKLYDPFRARGYLVFVTMQVSDNEDLKFDPADLQRYLSSQLYRLAVIKSDDPYDILRKVGTDGANHGLKTGDIILALQRWEKTYALRFAVEDAYPTGFTLVLEEAPDDTAAFVREALLFCPDMYQAVPPEVIGLYESIAVNGVLRLDPAGLERIIKDTKKVYFWWD